MTRNRIVTCGNFQKDLTNGHVESVNNPSSSPVISRKRMMAVSKKRATSSKR